MKMHQHDPLSERKAAELDFFGEGGYEDFARMAEHVAFAAGWDYALAEAANVADGVSDTARQMINPTDGDWWSDARARLIRDRILRRMANPDQEPV